jgi:hypothetical membrane protein
MRMAGIHLGWIAGVLCLLAMLVAGASTPGYSAVRHPVSLLGTAWSPHAMSFNLVGFGLAGLSIAGFALAFERALARGTGQRALRIGTGLLLIAGLAFAAQGLYPLDPEDLDATSSRRHAVANAVWRIAWIAAVTVLAFALRHARGWRLLCGSGVMLAVALAVDLVTPLVVLVPGWRAMPGTIERVALGAMLGWIALLVWRLRAPSRPEPR